MEWIFTFLIRGRLLGELCVVFVYSTSAAAAVECLQMLFAATVLLRIRMLLMDRLTHSILPNCHSKNQQVHLLPRRRSTNESQILQKTNRYR